MKRVDLESPRVANMPCENLHRRARSRHHLLQFPLDARNGRGEGCEHANLAILPRQPEGVRHSTMMSALSLKVEAA